MDGNYRVFDDGLVKPVKVPANGVMRERPMQRPADLMQQAFVSWQRDRLLVSRLGHNGLKQLNHDGGCVIWRHPHVCQGGIHEKPKPAAREDGREIVSVEAEKSIFQANGAICQFREPDGLERSGNRCPVDFVEQRLFGRKISIQESLRNSTSSRQPSGLRGQPELRKEISGFIEDLTPAILRRHADLLGFGATSRTCRRGFAPFDP